ncbi:LytR C-terminal domain-containing protein [Blastococcus goldschmidtiae]|uniref:LytR C-terminal domain-containing protein n=1 Tax=Blastococcus goldschmidtiae TaxID=3075546 RepID=A0ABU2KCN5_9ACTN|nr:LytR C-terminal domain-containing protein [Blastococcus sp. DSM 46792]MDT0277961.1 LytR C-terminal domain-containing protein [Blastococcus sp. DSM 46792]
MTTLRTERPTVRARSGRRPLPPLIFLLVLGLVAAGVWWNVFRQDAELQAEQDAACETAEPAPAALDPATVSVRVFNASDQAGIAQAVKENLGARGFTIAEVANDPTGREVTGVGEVRHGVGGKSTAAFLALYLPGADLYQDVRATQQVDLVLGPDFVIGESLATDEAVDAALAEAEEAANAC